MEPAGAARPGGSHACAQGLALSGGEQEGIVHIIHYQKGGGGAQSKSGVTGRQYLGLDGASWAEVADAKSLLGVVGTLHRTDDAGVLRSTAVRWIGTRPVPLLPCSVWWGCTRSRCRSKADRNRDEIIGP